jgi:predicted outer membrane repeat protein
MKRLIYLIYLSIVLTSLTIASCSENETPVEPVKPAPVITDISPKKGKSGVEVTFTGMNFGVTPEENTMTFNGKEAVVTSASETVLKALVPSEAGSGVVTVTVAGQSTSGPEFTWFPDNTRFVDGINGNNQGGSNNCEGPEFPCRTISHAVEISFGGDILHIADAEYTESFVIDKPLFLRGESESGTIIQAHDRPWQADGRVITIKGNFEMEITDVTIRHGNDFPGGGIAGHGGGMDIRGTTVNLTNVTLENNRASFGGGIYNEFAAGIYENVSFIGNQADQGGGIYNNLNSPSITTAFFIDNEASSSGGGIYNHSCSGIFENITFRGNVAGGSHSSHGGGGIYFYGSGTAIVFLREVTFEGNKTDGGGGGIRIENGDATLVNVDLIDNEALNWGGGMFIQQSSPTLTNVVLRGNSSNRGGAMYNWTDAYPSLLNVTISNNLATVDGGAMRNAENSSPRIRNTILWGNTTESDDGNGIANSSSASVELDHCIFQDGHGDIISGGGLSVKGSLNDNPLFINMENGDLRLTEDSPAIHAGDPGTEMTLFPNGPDNPTDRDGNPRFVGGRIDIGAYEYQ